MLKKVKIGNKILGYKEPCLISLEPGATYTRLEEAKKMVSASANANADAIKFQTFLTGDAERMMGKKDITVDFTTPTGKKKEFVYDALKRRELSKNEWKQLIEYTRDQNLLFITAPYFPETVDFLMDVGIDAFKISKGDINNVLLIEKVAKTMLPIILDAREKLEDVERAIKICEENNNEQIIIMHCPTGYPTENAGVHLSALQFLQNRYQYPIGFADHSPGDIMNYAATGLGVSMLEKTITQDKTIENVEHFMSLELDDLKNFVKNVRSIEEALGNPEILMKSRVEENARRSIIAKYDIKKGEKISRDLIDYQRPGDAGISCSKGFDIINKITKTDIARGNFIQWSMLEISN